MLSLKTDLSTDRRDYTDTDNTTTQLTDMTLCANQL